MKRFYALLVGLFIAALSLHLFNYLAEPQLKPIQKFQDPPGFIKIGRGIDRRMKTAYVEERLENHKWRQSHETLGQVLIPNSITKHQLYDHQNKKMIFNVKYKTDSFSRRTRALTPDRDQAILLFGGSFTYGHGLPMTETLDYFITQQSNEYVAYNYGFPGIGPNHTLAHIMSKKLNEEIQQQHGWAVYILIQDHVWRAYGSSIWRSGNMPYFTETENGAVNRETFRTGQPLLTQFLVYMRDISLVKRFSIQWPFNMNKNHVQYSCKLLLQMKKEIKRQLPNFRFAVVLHPFFSGGITDTSSAPFKDCFEKHHLLYFDYLNITSTKDIESNITIPHDGHPAAELNKHLANYILKDIAKQNQ